MTTEIQSHDCRPRPLAMAGIALSCVAASGFVGGATNAINGAVCPEYFYLVMDWQMQDVWRASIAQGIFEGLLFGIAFSLVFTVGTGIITQAACSYLFAMKHVLGIVIGSCACWIFGGMAGVGLAILRREFDGFAIFGVSLDFGSLLRFAWVGGSIWGVEFGGFISVVIALVIVKANWCLRHHPPSISD